MEKSKEKEYGKCGPARWGYMIMPKNSPYNNVAPFLHTLDRIPLPPIATRKNFPEP
jgi:hypothetical protein